MKDGGGSSPDGERPLAQSGRDAYSSITPAFGVLLILAILAGGFSYFVYFYLLLEHTAKRLANEDSELYGPLDRFLSKCPCGFFQRNKELV